MLWTFFDNRYVNVVIDNVGRVLRHLWAVVVVLIVNSDSFTYNPGMVIAFCRFVFCHFTHCGQSCVLYISVTVEGFFNLLGQDFDARSVVMEARQEAGSKLASCSVTKGFCADKVTGGV